MDSDFIILPSYLLPPKAYFSEILDKKTLIIHDEEIYKKQSLRNHFDILTSQDKLMITYPVKKPWRGKTIKDIEIDREQKWINNHWKSIKTAYGKAPFFEFYSEYFEADLKLPPDNLLELNLILLERCLNLLGLNVEILLLSNCEAKLKKNKKFSMQLDKFIYWDNYFGQQQDEMAYIQHFGNDFVKDLSIIDLLFNQGPESLVYLKKS